MKVAKKDAVSELWSGTEFQCKDCGGSFVTKELSKNYDPTYCPYCGSEALREV
jgi:DNA-directed RNA polymerase subunit RPC12/RpoP